MPANNASTWLDEQSSTPMIADKAKRLESFMQAIADGVVTDSELKSQEERLVKLMKEVEPQLDPKLHEQVTALLCELTAYDMMQVLNTMQQARPKTVFRG